MKDIELYDSIVAALARIEVKVDKLAKLCSAPEPDTQKLLTIKQASEKYQLSAQTLYRMPHVQVRVGRNVRISQDAMDRFCDRPLRIG